jgi:hypothetical protein
MSLWSRLTRVFGPERQNDALSAPLDTLVEAPEASATPLGARPMITPWSATRLQRIFEDFERSPSFGSLLEARLARQCLAQFWLMAPVDQLEMLYRSPIGACYRVLLAGPLVLESLTPEEVQWRTSLSERLVRAFQRPETTNVLLGVMPYFAPGKMRVADPQTQVPEWLQEDYARLFDPELFQRIWKPAGLLAPPGQGYGQAPSLGLHRQEAPQPPLAPTLPRLARQGGAAALALVQSGDYQSRMNGLINLFVIDPEDAQVRSQLVELRRLLGQIWLDAQPGQLEELYGASSFGRLYRDLLASGFSRLALSPEDTLLRNQLARRVADMSRPGGLNALMAVLPFYPPGKIAFGGGEQHMPPWLVQEIATIYGDPVPVVVSDETPSR